MPQKRNRYSARQIAFLRTGYMSMNVRDLTGAFNRRFRADRTEGQIRATLQRFHIRCGRKGNDRLINRLRIFTAEQVQFLRVNYWGRTVQELTDLFNQRFERAMTQRQIKSAVHNRHIVCGRTGQYEKGSRPWNYGTKGWGLTGRNRTTFAVGNAPANRKPVGTERLNVYGFIEIKVKERDPYTGFPTRYKLKHVHLWEQAHGPIPKRHVVAFIDGDPAHCELENLMMIPRAVLLVLNQLGYKAAPAELKPSLLALAKLKATAFARKEHRGGR